MTHLGTPDEQHPQHQRPSRECWGLTCSLGALPIPMAAEPLGNLRTFFLLLLAGSKYPLGNGVGKGGQVSVPCPAAEPGSARVCARSGGSGSFSCERWRRRKGRGGRERGRKKKKASSHMNKHEPESRQGGGRNPTQAMCLTRHSSHAATRT